MTVARARDDGHTWAEIGRALGTSRQAAFHRFGRPADPRTGRPMEPAVPDAGDRALALFSDARTPGAAGPASPQGRFLKMPYDLRRPTSDRIAARMWNPDDSRLFPPKALGWGYTINFYWLVHPLRYLAARS